MKKVWARKTKWDELRFWQAKTGWVREYICQFSGHHSGGRQLLPYSKKAPKDIDLDSEWGTFYEGQLSISWFEHLDELFDSEPVKILRRSHEVT